MRIEGWLWREEEEEEEESFLKRIVVGQVQVHNLMSKEDLNLVTLGYRFYLYDNTHAGQSVYLYSRFALLVFLFLV